LLVISSQSDGRLRGCRLRQQLGGAAAGPRDRRWAENGGRDRRGYGDQQFVHAIDRMGSGPPARETRGRLWRGFDFDRLRASIGSILADVDGCECPVAGWLEVWTGRKTDVAPASG